MAKNRKQYEIMETHYMKAGYYHPDKCFYCGVRPDTLDHVPPLSWAYSLGYQIMVDKHNAPFIKVPCCSECNSLLNDKNIFSLDKRKEYIAETLEKRYKKFVKNPKWELEEIKELTGNLKKFIRNVSDYKSHIDKRIDWAKSDPTIAYAKHYV